MTQLELFEEDGPQPIQRWLHVWTDAQREMMKKSPTRAGVGVGSGFPEREETADKAACQRITLPSCGDSSAELPTAHPGADPRSGCVRVMLVRWLGNARRGFARRVLSSSIPRSAQYQGRGPKRLRHQKT